MFIEGIFDILRVPIAFILKICHDFCNWLGIGNYLFALLFFAVIMQVILLPFAIKQQKNSIKQAKFAPKVAAIRNKYKGRNDKATQQKIQEETMALYNKENFNPMGGCLPLLIQMPILFALFRVITMPMRYLAGIHTEAINKMIVLSNKLWSSGVSGIEQITSQDAYSQIKLVSNLRAIGEGSANAMAKAAGVTDFSFSKIPNFKMFGGAIDLCEAPQTVVARDGFWNWMLLIPVITVIALLFSQWLTKKFTYQDPMQQNAQNGCGMKAMLYAMPLMSGYFAFIVAAAIGIYWIFRNLLSLLQQIILSKAMPLPVFTEEDYKAAEKEMYKTQVKKKSGERDPNRPKVRSLHHIDDEDDEEVADDGRVTRYDEDESAKDDADSTEPVETDAGGDPSGGTDPLAAPLKDDKGKKFEKKKKK